jgi:uncharacterized protein
LKLHQALNTGQKTFTSLGEGYIAVNGEHFNRPVVVTPEQVRTDWSATDFATLIPAHFEYFVALAPEVVIFGTGSCHQFPHPQLYRSLIDAHIAIEFMDTPAACRTYNILATEDRKVVAAILL